MKKLSGGFRPFRSECRSVKLRRASRYSVLSIVILTLLFSSPSGPQDFPFPNSYSRPGQSSTLLPDGRWLLSGGEDSNRSPSPAASIWDPVSGQLVSLGPLNHARAWHSATILPDGTVLILGGVGTHGKIVSDAELFDPETQTSETLSLPGLTPRARHTATLLTDGTLLITGGLGSNGRQRNDAELWNFEDHSALSLSSRLSQARYNHTATLLADGRMLLSGGIDANGNALDNGELFDPSTGLFTALSASQIENLKSQIQNLELAASLPSDGSVDVSLDTLIAVRFSRPMRVETVNSHTVILNGPNGIEQIKVVPAEGGMLGFITPLAALLPNSTYTVTLNGPVDKDGFFLPVSSFSFTTESDDSSQPPGPPPSPPTDGDQGPGYNYLGDDGWMWNGERRDGKPHSSWQDLPPLLAEAGVTALSGQVLDLKGEPLVNATLEIGYGSQKLSAQSDETGRFLIANIQAGWSELVIDGRKGRGPKSKSENERWGYGVYEYGLEIKNAETNVLPFTIWLTKIDAKNAVKITSPTVASVIATTPYIPGLELHLPANTVIYDHDWKLRDEVSLTPLPLDRTPFPLPRNVDVPIYFTAQPGAGYVRNKSTSEGARIIYPNYKNKLPGTRFNFWHYDPGYRGWYIYGLGTVMEDGKQVVPDPGISIREFTGAMVADPTFGPADWPPPCCDGGKGADPVDLYTGLFEHLVVDVTLPDIMPLTLSRTYRTRDTVSRAFGIGASHSYDYFLIGDTFPYSFQDLVLPDGARIHYTRIDGGAGDDFTVAVYEHTTTPTRFYKSKITWNGNGWDLKLRDGTLYVFRDGFGATRPGHAGMIRAQDRNGNAHKIDRDINGNVTKITSFPSGRWIELTSDASNRVTQVRDNIGRTLLYTYDGTGRLTQVTDPKAGIWLYTYDTFSRMTTIKNPRNVTIVTNEYNAAGKVIRQTVGNGGVYTFAYTLDGNGKTIQADITDPRNFVRRVTFDSSGYSLSVTRALGTPEEQVTTYVRDAQSSLRLSVIDALGRKSEYSYDSMGNVLSATRLADTPNAVTTTFTYEPTFNQVATVTDPLNHTTNYGYDTKGNLTAVTNPLNQITTITRNSEGQATSEIDPLNNITQFGYSSGDLVTLTDPLGNVTTGFTDAAGRLLKLTDALGNITSYDYDAMDYLTKVTDALSGITEYTYDSNGNLLSVTDAQNHSTGYTYENTDRLATRIDPLLHGESYVYDNNGNLTQFTDRKGQVTAYIYDGLNRRIQATYADTSTTTYTYDKGNRLTQVVDSVSGTITRTYDGLDRLTSETTPRGSVTYTYDAAGRRTFMTVAGQPAINYGYDDANRLTQISQGPSTAAFAYDNAGRRTSLTLPNAILVEYSYNAASRVTSITYKHGTTILGDLTYEYDKAGNRTKIGGTWARSGLPSAVSSAAYNAANQQTTFGDKTLNYDNNGNLTSITDASGTVLYTWNVRNQFNGISSPSLNANFVYDGMGRREKKTINSNLTEFLFDGVKPVQETSGATILANILPGLGIDELLTRTDVPSGITSHFLADTLGSAVALTDSAGTLQTEYTYEPFGVTSTSGTPNSNPFKYTGREDDGTGLYYYRARYYNSLLQRFISEDPIGLKGGDVNFYAYVNNSPLVLSDPLGLAGAPPEIAPKYQMKPDTSLDLADDLIGPASVPWFRDLNRAIMYELDKIRFQFDCDTWVYVCHYKAPSVLDWSNRWNVRIVAGRNGKLPVFPAIDRTVTVCERYPVQGRNNCCSAP